MNARARLALATLVALAGCRGDRPAARASADGGPIVAGTAEVRIHLAAEPPHLNPLLSSDFTITQIALGDIYEPLYTLDARGAVVPVLADKVDVAADGTAYTFTLREGVRWHDGTPCTADDVAFTFGLLAPGGAPAVLAADVDDLVGIDRPDARTVRLRFRGFRLGRDESLALVPVLPRHVFGDRPAADLLGHPASRAPVGTGPLAFEAWTPGEIRLRRARTWRGAPAAAARVAYRVVADRAQALAQLAAGELHLVLSLPPGPLLDEAAGDARVTLLPYAFPYVLAARWRCTGGAIADPRVRRALTMLLDRETVVREVLRGRGRLASAPWAPDDPASDPQVAPWPFDPAGAKALLAEAGVKALRVELLVPAGSATLERVATLWQADARAAGVTLDVVPDADVIGRARRGEFTGGLAFGWSTGREQDLYHHFHSSQIGADNYGACADAELDALLAAVRTTAEPAARVALEHRLHRRLHELEPITVVSIDVRTAAASSRLRGARPGPHGTPAASLSLAPR